MGDGLCVGWVYGIGKATRLMYFWAGGGNWEGPLPYVFLGGGLSPKRWRSELRPVLPACLPTGVPLCRILDERDEYERKMVLVGRVYNFKNM